MSDLTASNCGCGCDNGCGGGSFFPTGNCGSNNNCSWIIILILLFSCCGNGNSFLSNDGCGCGGNNSWIIILILLFSCGGCGNNNGCGC